MFRRSVCLVLFSLFALAPHPAAATGGDRLVFYDFGQLLETTLPVGSIESLAHPDSLPVALAYGPDGELYAVLQTVLSPPSGPFLARYQGDGRFENLLDLTSLEVGLAISGTEWVADMAFDGTGRLFLLVRGLTLIAPPLPFSRLLVLEAGTLMPIESHPLISSYTLPIPDGLAPAPHGLWLLASEQLYRFYPEAGALVDSGLELGSFGAITAADTDSAGGIWFAGVPGFADPPVSALSRLDPTTGGLTRRSLGTPGGTEGVAIERRCRAGDTRRCLQGGRFAVEATWRDAEGNADTARVAPAGSADTALLWFFEPSNWELMVKVLDGCDINGHFWVYSAASTDVEYQLTVTDLETGQLFTYQNPLGMASPAINETEAFAPCR